MNVDKVISILEGYRQCGFGDKDDSCTVADILELLKTQIVALKKQEPIYPERSGKGTYWYYCCKACGQPLDPGDLHCRKCGQAVKWND